MPYGLTDLFSGASAQAPQGPRDEDLPAALRETFDAYLADLARVEPVDDVTRGVRAGHGRAAQLAAAILDALEHSFRGQPHQARATLEAGLEPLRDRVEAMYLTDGVSARDRADPQVYYRVRAGAPAEQWDWRDLFHIPFERAHLVRPQRYSVPGVLMLYLGASLETCWEEMGRPDPRTLWAAAFRLRGGQTLNLLNLALRPTHALHLVRTRRDGLAAAHALVWPLVLACSYRVKYRGPSVAFVPEYVIPQLVTSWVSESSDYAGIRYFSSRAETNPRFGWGDNLALPARAYAPKGLCENLTAMWEVSRPFSWVEAEARGMFRVLRPRVEDDRVVATARDGAVLTSAASTFVQMEYALAQFAWPTERKIDQAVDSAFVR